MQLYFHPGPRFRQLTFLAAVCSGVAAAQAPTTFAALCPAVSGTGPSAGVGRAFGRAACDELAAQINHVLSPPVSLTEVYDFSFRLFRNGRKSDLDEVGVMNTENPSNPYEELVAIREFFPVVFGDAIWQKQRWMLGSTFQGWAKLGWGKSWRERYVLLRGGIGVVTSLLNAVTLLILMDLSEAIVWTLGHHRAGNADFGRFDLPGLLAGLIGFSIALLIYRDIRRRQMLMVPFRLIWGNVIDFYCTMRAVRSYVFSRVTGKPLKWLKTAHESPNVEQLLRTVKEPELPAPVAMPVMDLDIPPLLKPVFAAAARVQSNVTPVALPTTALDLESLKAGVPAWLQVQTPPEADAAASQPIPAYSVQPSARPVLVAPRVDSIQPTPTPSAVPIAKGPAPVIPISRPHRSAHTPARRFSMLHDVASKWKAPFPSKRILIAIGTRPEAIKLAPLVLELQDRIGTRGGPEDVLVCATGQYSDMVEEALAIFGVEVDANLEVMAQGQTLADVSARILARFSQVIADFRPDWVVVQGDTATTVMAGLAAFYAGVRVAHVEAGLRTRDLAQPFPEEFNRRMVGIFANVHFAATEWAKNNLLREGVDAEDIVVTGNTGIDALHTSCERLGIALDGPRPAHHGPVRVLVTAHRRENLEAGITNICGAISNLVNNHPGRFVFLWPLQPNPRVSETVRVMLGEHRHVLTTGPAKYDELLGHLDQCDVVLTDSGGLQEEAASFGRPVLILREKTERPEGVRAGMAWLVGTDRERIEGALEQLADQIAESRTLRTPMNPYGDGFASNRIADFFAGMPVLEFGMNLERDEIPRKMPVPVAAMNRLSSVS